MSDDIKRTVDPVVLKKESELQAARRVEKFYKAIEYQKRIASIELKNEIKELIEDIVEEWLDGTLEDTALEPYNENEDKPPAATDRYACFKGEPVRCIDPRNRKYQWALGIVERYIKFSSRKDVALSLQQIIDNTTGVDTLGEYYKKLAKGILSHVKGEVKKIITPGHPALKNIKRKIMKLKKESEAAEALNEKVLKEIETEKQNKNKQFLIENTAQIKKIYHTRKSASNGKKS